MRAAPAVEIAVSGVASQTYVSGTGLLVVSQAASPPMRRCGTRIRHPGKQWRHHHPSGGVETPRHPRRRHHPGRRLRARDVLSEYTTAIVAGIDEGGIVDMAPADLFHRAAWLPADDSGRTVLGGHAAFRRHRAPMSAASGGQISVVGRHGYTTKVSAGGWLFVSSGGTASALPLGRSHFRCGAGFVTPRSGGQESKLAAHPAP